MHPRLFFIDPSLGAEAGHHSVVAKNYAMLAAPLGREIVFVGHKRHARTGEAGLPDFNALFSYTVADAFRVARYGKAWMAQPALVKLTQAMLRLRPRTPMRPTVASNDRRLSATQCSAMLKPLGAGPALDRLTARYAPGPSDHVVFLNIDPALIAAMYDRSEWRTPQASLHVLFMYPEEEMFGVAARVGLLQIYKELFGASARFHFYGESPTHADWLASLIARPVKPMMSPVRLSPLPTPPVGDITVTMLGAARRDKGFALAPEIVAIAAKANPAMRFRIQAPTLGGGLRDIERALRAMPTATLLPPVLSNGAYEAELARAHIVLLPYDPLVFAQRWSGVLVDALIAGRPLTCTRGTAMEHAVARGNGLAAAGAEEFAKVLTTIATRYPDFLAAAQAEARRHIGQIEHGPLLQALAK